MKIKLKLVPSTKNEWLGWFGDDLIKVRIKSSPDSSLEEDFFKFLKDDLGVNRETVEVKEFRNNILHLELPDIAWELFLTVVK